MNTKILVLLLILILMFTSCQNYDNSELIKTDTTTEVEESILYESNTSFSYKYIDDWSYVKEHYDYIMECEVIERLPPVLRGGYSDSELAKIDELRETDPKKASYMAMSIKTPLKVKVNKIFYSTQEDIKEGDTVTLDEWGGNYKGVKSTLSDIKTLNTGETYLIVTKRVDDSTAIRNSIVAHPQFYIKVDSEKNGYVIEYNTPNALVENIISYDELISEIENDK